VFGPVNIRCRTLVDELSNLSRTYRRGGKLELKSNDARNYKEDCHRLWGTTNSWVAYHVTGHITAVRVFAFGEPDEAALEFHSGSEGGKGGTLAAQNKDFYAGKDMYNFRPPRLFTLGPLPDNGSELVIQFLKETQIGRVEIEYR
jgi:hypothetical protein